MHARMVVPGLEEGEGGEEIMCSRGVEPKLLVQARFFLYSFVSGAGSAAARTVKIMGFLQ
jgi:hypothetical protein